MVALVGIVLALIDLAREPQVRRPPALGALVALGALPRHARADPARRRHGHPRPAPARGDVALPPRAGRARGAIVVALEAWSQPGGLGVPRRARAGCGTSSRAVGVAACAALVVTGAVATASGPHPGAARTSTGSALGSSTPSTSTCARPPSSGSASSSSASSSGALRRELPGHRRGGARAARRPRRPDGRRARSSTATPCPGGSS